MKLDTIDLVLWLIAISMEALLFGLVIWKQIYKTLPVFSSFFLWCLLSDGGMGIASRFPDAYLPATLVNITIDALFQLAILAELMKVVVRHNKVTPPSKMVIFLLTVLTIVLSGSLNRWSLPNHLPLADVLYLVLMVIYAVLRVVFLLTLVWWSLFRGLRWPSRELRIVSGLGVYIFATLCVAFVHSRGMGGMQFHWLDQSLVGIYLWTLLYWVFATTTSVVEEP